jgi:hypothetical protein
MHFGGDCARIAGANSFAYVRGISLGFTIPFRFTSAGRIPFSFRSARETSAH